MGRMIEARDCACVPRGIVCSQENAHPQHSMMLLKAVSASFADLILACDFENFSIQYDDLRVVKNVGRVEYCRSGKIRRRPPSGASVPLYYYEMADAKDGPRGWSCQ